MNITELILPMITGIFSYFAAVINSKVKINELKKENEINILLLKEQAKLDIEKYEKISVADAIMSVFKNPQVQKMIGSVASKELNRNK
ncbi:hypothetical protein AAHH67_15975 [Niallia circulans]